MRGERRRLEKCGGDECLEEERREKGGLRVEDRGCYMKKVKGRKERKREEEI